ncbi:basal body protein 10-like [Miscanthus floridulus]|uniref:basal body protein 10-like n=1 Tax=Miscanthus floridulus TaxID=154761 RepID=UPI00345A8175
MARRRRLFEMTPSDPVAGTKMSAFALTDDETLRRGRGGAGVRRGPAGAGGHRGRAAATTAAVAEEADGVEAVASPFAVSVFPGGVRFLFAPWLHADLGSVFSCSQTLLVGDPPLAPRKALKVNVSSSVHQAAEAQADAQRGAESGEAVSEEVAAQEKGAEAAAGRVEEEEPTPRDVVGLGATEAGASSTAEAIEGEAGAPKTSEARAVDSGAIEVEMAEARAPGSVETEAMEVEAGQTLAPPLVQTISSDDSSRGKEAADAEAASTAEQQVPDPAEGSSALVPLRPEPPGWNFPRVFWRDQADPEGEPVFALEDVAEGGRWDTLEEYRRLAVRSLQTAMTVMERDLPGVTRELETRSLGKSVFLRNERDIWDQLRRQKGLLADAQGLLSARSAEVEDLRLRCADIQAELAMAKEQSAPLVAKIKELEEERDSFRLRAQEATASAKATAGQLGAEQSEHQATKVALAEATKAAEASRVEVSAWKGKAEDLEKEASQAAEASVAAQAALDVEVREHEALRSAVRSACEALDVEEVQSASSLGSRLIALSGHVRERLRGALHTGVKRALAVVSSHYAINLEAVSDGYVLPEDDEEADAEVVRLLEAAEAPGTALAKLFEEEVVPPAPAADP